MVQQELDRQLLHRYINSSCLCMFACYFDHVRQGSRVSSSVLLLSPQSLFSLPSHPPSLPFSPPSFPCFPPSSPPSSLPLSLPSPLPDALHLLADVCTRCHYDHQSLPPTAGIVSQKVVPYASPTLNLRQPAGTLFPACGKAPGKWTWCFLEHCMHPVCEEIDSCLKPLIAIYKWRIRHRGAVCDGTSLDVYKWNKAIVQKLHFVILLP